MNIRSALAFALLVSTLSLWLPEGARGSGNADVVIIVGPVGALTDTYRDLAEQSATAAERHGATVRRAYSPDADPEQVLTAVEGADIVIYFGHGTGYPNPYSDTLNPETANGWGLQGPQARATDDDALADGSLAYFGEAWIARHARPAPGFVMIYSNVCYAPGAGEGHDAPSTPEVAAQRAGYYSRTPLAMGAGAVFATDYYAGAATLVDTLLGTPGLPYGEVFAADPRFEATGLTSMAHPFADAGNELWLHRSAYFEGKVDYWYAFAGDPAASFAGGVGGLGSPRSYEPARGGMLLAGSHELVRFDADGTVIEGMDLELPAATTVSFSARQRHGDDAAAWLKLAAPHAGWWLAESPAAYVAGIAAQAALAPARQLELSTGTHAAHHFDASGAASASRTLSVAASHSIVVDAEAVINGLHHLRLRDGALAGHWMQVTDAVRLGAAVVEPLTSDPRAASASPSPSARPSPAPSAAPAAAVSPAPRPSLPSPPAPPDPPTPVPSPSVSPTPSPSSVPSPSATPAPSATPSPAPSDTPGSSPSPTPTPTPSSG